MAYYKWDHEKNERTKAERGIGFEQVILHIERGSVIDVIEHPNQYLNIQINKCWLSNSKTIFI